MWKTFLWIILMLAPLLSGQLPVTPPQTPYPEWTAEQLKEIPSRNLLPLFKEHGLFPMGLWIQNEALHIQVRNQHRHWEHPSDQSIAELRQTLYEFAGSPFPLFLETYALSPDKPEIKGRITKIDEASQRALIIDPSEPLSDGYPDATWIKMFEDGNIVRSADKIALEFKDLKIGQRVEGWTWGIILESLPAQTELLELIVLEEPEEDGPYIPFTAMIGNDLEGVTKIDVRYGDGHSLTIEDDYLIRGITGLLQMTLFKKSDDQEPVFGYLYVMDLYIGDQKIRYNSNAYYHSIRYTSNPITQVLDESVVNYGRKQIPGLLPGIKIK